MVKKEDPDQKDTGDNQEVVEVEKLDKQESAFILSCTYVDADIRKKLLDPEIQSQERQKYIDDLIAEKLLEIDAPERIDFLTDYSRSLLTEYQDSKDSKKISQKAGELLVLLKMRLKGVKDPEAVLSALRNNVNVYSYHTIENPNHDKYRITGFDHSRASKPDLLNFLSKLSNPALVLQRLHKIGVDFGPYTDFSIESLSQMLEQLGNISDNHFDLAVTNLGRAWWLDSISIMSDSYEDVRGLNNEFVERLKFVVSGDFIAEQKNALERAERLVVLTNGRVSLHKMFADQSGLDSSTLIAEEHYFAKRDRDPRYRESYKNGLKSLGKEDIVAEMIRSGLHFTKRDSVLDRSDAYNEEAQEKLKQEIDLAYEKLNDPVYVSMRAYLELTGISDILIVDQAVKLLKSTKEVVKSLSVEKQAVFAQQIITTEWHAIDDVLKYHMLHEWLNFAGKVSKRNEEYHISESKVKSLLINCFIFDDNGLTDTTFLRQLLKQPVSINSLITDSVLARTNESEHMFFDLISKLDEKNNSHIQDFLTQNESILPNLLDSSGNITPEFCHAFAEFDKSGDFGTPAHIDSIKPLILAAKGNFSGNREGDFWTTLMELKDCYIYYNSYKKFMDLPQIAVDLIINNIKPTGDKIFSIFTHYLEETKQVISEAKGSAQPPFELMKLIFDKCSNFYWKSNFPIVDFKTVFGSAIEEIADVEVRERWKTILFTNGYYQLSLYEKYDELSPGMVSENGSGNEKLFNQLLSWNLDNLRYETFQQSLAEMLGRADVDSFPSPDKEFWKIYLIVAEKVEFRKLLLHAKVEGKISSQNTNDVLNLISSDEYLSNPLISKVIFQNFNYLLEIGPELTKKYIVITQKIDTSPSTEIARIKNELIPELLKTSDPEAVFNRVEDIFIRNNLPLVGKLFKIFQILNPISSLSETIEINAKISPVIKKQSERRVYHTFYSDLVKINLRSSNRSLVKYLESAQKATELLQEHLNGTELSLEQRGFIVHFLDRVTVLLDSSSIENATSDIPEYSVDEYDDVIATFVKKLKISSSTQISDRLARMFLYPAGIHSVQEAIDYSAERRLFASQRNIEFSRLVEQNGFHIGEGDLFKGLIRMDDFHSGVGYDYFRNMLQTGSVAKDFLGASASSDSTPFDTDVIIFTQDDLTVPVPDLLRGTGAGSEVKVVKPDGTTVSLKRNLSSGYGSLYLLVKNRDQFYRSDKNEVYTGREKYELFYTGIIDYGGQERHFGVRTGLPSSEYDCLLADDSLVSSKETLHNIKFMIAEQGQYIPIVDFDGNQLYSLEEYEKYRKTFSGIHEFFGSNILINSGYSSQREREILRLSQEVKTGREVVSVCSTEIRTKIAEVLSKHGVKLLTSYESSLLGAELHDIGSTGRGTNAPSDYDFDFALLLDSKDIGKAKEIYDDLMTHFSYEGTIPSGDTEEHLQLRLTGVAIGGRKVDIDIGINTKKEVDVFASHDAVKAKLNSVKEAMGEEAHDKVVASIILAKQILKKGNAYKKGPQQQGGWGGIGTEYWILQHQGNLDIAMQSVWEASTNGTASLKEFKSKYAIYDAGMNIKFKRRYENFVDYLTEEGYKSLIKVVNNYLSGR